MSATWREHGLHGMGMDLHAPAWRRAWTQHGPACTGIARGTRASPRNDGAQDAADASSSDGVPSLLPTPRESSTVGSPPLSRHFESPFGLSRGRATLQQQSHAVSDAAAVARVVGDGGNAGKPPYIARAALRPSHVSINVVDVP